MRRGFWEGDIHDPLQLAINIATTFFFTFVHVVVPLIPKYALVMGLQPFVIGLAASSVSITAIALRPFGGVMSDRWSRVKLMVIELFRG